MNDGPTVHGERGSVSLFIVLLMPVLVLFAGLVLDGGRQLQARRDALAAAASSARAAIQMTPREATRGLDRSLAAGRARAELARRGFAGVIHVSGRVVRVTARASIDFVILPGGTSVAGSAQVSAQRGVERESRQ
jgi:hypothetical protein